MQLLGPTSKFSTATRLAAIDSVVCSGINHVHKVWAKFQLQDTVIYMVNAEEIKGKTCIYFCQELLILEPETVVIRFVVMQGERNMYFCACSVQASIYMKKMLF